MTGQTLNGPGAPPLQYDTRPGCIFPRPGQQEHLVRREVCHSLSSSCSQSGNTYSHVVILVTKNHPKGCHCGQLVQRLDAPLGTCHIPIHGLGEVTHIGS